MGQGDSARDFAPSESMENAGILCVFPIFHTARLGEKICRSPQYPLCGVAIKRQPDLPIKVNRVARDLLRIQPLAMRVAQEKYVSHQGLTP